MAWYSSWTRAQRLVITVPSGTVTALSYFPVVLTAASLPTELTNNTYGRSDGGDLAFAADLGLGNSVSSIGSQIPCEVVSAAFGGSPSAEIHVQVPSVAATGTLTYIWVLYSNSGQTAQPAASSTYGSQNVWNENGVQNYQGVWHFGTPSTLNVNDSTSNANISTNHGATAGTGPWSGGAATIGNANYIDAGSSSSLAPSGNFTISGWANQVAAGSNANDIIGRDNSAPPNREYILRLTTSGNVYAYVYDSSGNSTGITGGSAISFGTWVCLQAVYTYIGSGTSSYTIYVNGTQVGTSSIAIGPPSNATGYNTWLGARMQSFHDYFYGSIDEVRIANVARSASWVASDYANQSAPGTFIEPPSGQGPISLVGAAGILYCGMPVWSSGNPIYFAL